MVPRSCIRTINTCTTHRNYYISTISPLVRCLLLYVIPLQTLPCAESPSFFWSSRRNFPRDHIEQKAPHQWTDGRHIILSISGTGVYSTDTKGEREVGDHLIFAALKEKQWMCINGGGSTRILACWHHPIISNIICANTTVSALWPTCDIAERFIRAF